MCREQITWVARYAIGSIRKHKNYKWIRETAKKYSSRQFLIAGNINKNAWGVDDSELHPSKYEGFGIPPLEALALGKKIIISNATCLPEIYKDSAAYFDPDDYEADLDELERKPVHGANEVLENYTWRKAAEKWVEAFLSF